MDKRKAIKKHHEFLNQGNHSNIFGGNHFDIIGAGKVTRDRDRQHDGQCGTIA